MNTRSRRRRRGLPAWRLRTINWWRRTTTSTSVFISSLEQPAIIQTTRRSRRYTRAKNKDRTSQVKGHAAGVRARLISSGKITGTGKAKRVEQGGELYGVEADEIE
jgi:hypothetical protein